MVINMKYITQDGREIIGDTVKYKDGHSKKMIIGVNYFNGIKIGGYLSSFDREFTNELIGIEFGIGDIVYSKIGDVKDAYETLKNKLYYNKNNDLYSLSRCIYETVDEYFGGKNNISTRPNYYYDLDDSQIANNKISNLKKTGAAMCVERAALAQNLLFSLGIRSVYKCSEILNGNVREIHSYNIIEYNNKYYIFDTSLPNIINNESNPLIAEIDKESFDLICNPLHDIGCSITISHPMIDRKDITITYDSGRDKSIVASPICKETKHK